MGWVDKSWINGRSTPSLSISYLGLGQVGLVSGGVDIPEDV